MQMQLRLANWFRLALFCRAHANDQKKLAWQLFLALPVFFCQSHLFLAWHQKVLHSMLQVYTTPGASQYWNVATKETHRSSNVSMAPTSSSGRMTVVGMLLSGSNRHQSSSRSTTCVVRLATTLRFGFKVCMFFSCSKIRMKCTSYLCTPIAKHLLSSRKIPAYGWWAGQSSVRCVRLKADKAYWSIDETLD